jgi:hypothetical protein
VIPSPYPTPTSLFICPGPSSTVGTIGWLSPITGTVTLTYSITDVTNRPANDGATYTLFVNGGASIDSGVLAEGATHSYSANVAVVAGDIVALGIGPHGAPANDDIQITGLTVSAVPEPGAITLLACGLVSLLAYAWRKRK